MFAPSRSDARRFLANAWTKYKAGSPLEGLEPIAAQIIAGHPEYQPLLDDPERNLERDFTPEGGAANPFLHLSLHLAVAEQLSIDQPAGIRAEFTRLKGALGDEHAALHAVIDCLGEVLWQAQRQGRPPDAVHYLECLGGRK
jgi:hypothetical protein